MIKPLVEKKSGHIIKFTGDGFLVEFPSIQDAVVCAIELQETLVSSPLNFRMGINMGDITDDGGDVHGEGVNIAARLEALADSGGICISGTVYEQVRNRIDATFKDLGDQEVKNVSRPVRIWKILSNEDPQRVMNAQDVEQEIRYCTSPDGTALAYAKMGHGPPLLKSAHFMTHLEHDWHSPTFGPFFREMATTHSFVRYDQRGNGLSDRNPEDISYELHVDDIETVADAAGLQRFPIYGLSQGAAVAISYAVKNPQRVSALILHGGYARGRLKRDNLSEDDRLKVEALTNLIRTGWGQNNPAFRQMFTTMFIPDASVQLMDSFNELMSVATEPAIAAKIFEVNAQIDVSNILHQVRAPTFIVHGRHDAVSPFEEGRKMAALIPGARLIELDTANHLPLHDEPVFPRLIAEINKFLAEHPVP
ncbi:MAG: alpha/beta fold hydrolase [Rhodospirillales bacterium]|nr:alpha/beta fold hydrolase [Rhodospirillales bacterium]